MPPATQDIFSALSRRTVLLAGTALIMVVVAATVLTIWLLRVQALERAEWHLGNLAAAVAGHADQSFHSLGLALLATAEDVRSELGPGGALVETKHHQRVLERVKALPHVRAIVVIDREGSLKVHSDLFPAPAVNYTDRDYFRALRDHPVNGLYVSEPILGRTTRAWTYTVSRRVEDDRGEFRGVIVGAVLLDYFRDFYRSLGLGDEGRVMVFRSDGVLLASYPMIENAIGRRFAADPLFGQPLASAEGGVMRRAGFLDTKARIVAYRRLADESVVVAVSSTQDFVLSDWYRHAFQLGVGGTVMVLVVGFAMLLALRQLRVRAVLEGELADTGAQLHRIVNTAMDAIITVNEQQSIVMFNAAAERIFRVPAAEALGQPLDRFIPERFRAAHRRHVWRFGETGDTTRVMGQRLALAGLRADGEEFPIDASISQIAHESGKLFTVILRDITGRRKAEDALAQSYEELRELSAAMNEVREAERTRIARELHDELAQWLTALKMDVSWLAARLPREPQHLSERADKMKGIVDTTVTAVRRIAADLRPVVLDDLGLVAATENLLHDFSQRAGVVVSHDLDAGADDFGEPLATSLYRMMQEALTNVARHAAATEVRVTLSRENDDLVVRVRDNGRGFDPEAAARRKSYGVLGIRERAQTLGGRAHVGRHEAGGTIVEIVIPVARYRKRRTEGDQRTAC